MFTRALKPLKSFVFMMYNDSLRIITDAGFFDVEIHESKD